MKTVLSVIVYKIKAALKVQTNSEEGVALADTSVLLYAVAFF